MPDRSVTWVRIGNRYPDLKGEADHFLRSTARSRRR
jgi:hypothetical protein